MCGISLIISSRSGKEAENAGKAAIARMQQAQQHRGPDSGGEVVLPWKAGTLFFGSRRLQILDRGKGADQPMHRQWQHRQAWLSYNGELYNYTDLRNELLQLGCQFSSNSDTEVVLYALLVWGKEVLQRFNGMFALAYYESHPEEPPLLLLARDRWGQKPLYLAQQDGDWIIASELQALFSSGALQKELNQRQVFQYLRYKHAARPETFFAGVQELPPGCCWQFGPDQEVDKHTFTAPAPAILTAVPDEKTALDQLEEKLVDSLIAHLQSDKPVGLFLSGGVDSTLMLAMLREHAAWLLPLCFTAGNAAAERGWGTQDLPWAGKAATQYEAYHQILTASADSVLEQFAALATRQDQPIADSAWLLTCLLSEFAATKVKVVLSGAGADELFGGYNRHTAFAWYLQHQKNLTTLLPLLKRGSRFLPAGLPVPGRAQWQLARKFSRNLAADPHQTFLNFTSLAILQQEVVEEQPLPEQVWLQWALEHDRSQYLVSDVLALNDKAGMQYGLEMRMPYLDAGLTDYVRQLPASFLLKKGQKWLLKALLERYGGKAYTQRRKEGFGLPFGLWIRQGKTEALWQWLEDKNHPLHPLLSPEVAQQLLQAHKRGRADYSQELMALALLALWLEKNFN